MCEDVLVISVERPRANRIIQVDYREWHKSKSRIPMDAIKGKASPFLVQLVRPCFFCGGRHRPLGTLLRGAIKELKLKISEGRCHVLQKKKLLLGSSTTSRPLSSSSSSSFTSSRLCSRESSASLGASPYSKGCFRLSHMNMRMHYLITDWKYIMLSL